MVRKTRSGGGLYKQMLSAYSPAELRTIEPESLQSLLLEAIRAKDLPAVKTFISAGANVNRVIPLGRNSPKETVLMVACVTRNVGIVHEIIAAGADVNERSETEWTPLITPLEFARLAGDKALEAELIANGATMPAEPDPRYVNNPFGAPPTVGKGGKTRRMNKSHKQKSKTGKRKTRK
jgi:hypothetical protein